MMMRNYGGFSGPADTWVLGALALLLLLGGVFLLVAWARREALSPRRRHVQLNEHRVAADVLKERYATGKITLAEYEQSLKTLGEDALISQDAASDSSAH